MTPHKSYTNPTKATGNVHKGCVIISLIHAKFRIDTLSHFLFMTESDTTPPVQKEKLDLKLISKWSNKSERPNVFKVFEQSDESDSDSDLEVSENDYNQEINESSDSEEDSSQSISRSKF